ncbi:MAG: glycosyltransferase [Gemmataceae bacterium]|nr:glycosyltransferase [Gemmataceae bacterium]
MELTIGMAAFRDFDGVFFTVQALRLYQDLENIEILVVDNEGCSATRDFVQDLPGCRYLLAQDVTGTAAPRDLVFRAARGEAVLCLDCHVLLAPGVVARLKRYYRDHPHCQDLLQGPLLFDDLEYLGSHLVPEWTDGLCGAWGFDERALDPEGEAFEIPMQGLGLFSCRRDAWPGFNPRFRGFGGEEGYIHQKVRNLGRRCLCLPWLRWSHRFVRPGQGRYTIWTRDKLHNYLVGFDEVGLDLQPVLRHFQQLLGAEEVARVTEQALGRPVPVEPEAPGNSAGLWDSWFEGAEEPAPFGETATYDKAAAFLGKLRRVEDWGCGLAWFRQYLRPQQYRGLDGSCSPFADEIVDLCAYTSKADGILMRHVLEHNHHWEKVLTNALQSFQRRMCLILYRPFEERTAFAEEHDLGGGRLVPFYSFRREDIVRHFEGVCRYTEERVGTETVFYLKKGRG